jgi:hypothetical protein
MHRLDALGAPDAPDSFPEKPPETNRSPQAPTGVPPGKVRFRTPRTPPAIPWSKPGAMQRRLIATKGSYGFAQRWRPRSDPATPPYSAKCGGVKMSANRPPIRAPHCHSSDSATPPRHAGHAANLFRAKPVSGPTPPGRCWIGRFPATWQSICQPPLRPSDAGAARLAARHGSFPG